MAIQYKNLDEQTRKFMLKEMEKDVKEGTLYISPRLNSTGQSEWAKLLEDAIAGYNDDWLATQLNEQQCMKSDEERKLRSGEIKKAKVPVNAPETLAEGEFNRFYARGICVRAIAEGISEVIVYRGKQVQRPRQESQAMIGRRIDPQALLEDLRKSQGVEPALGIPPGPNSGLTISLP
ncbi:MULTISPECIES: hypothetical protein [Petrotoga]|uniref:Uncharacterized protein n=1 Tax=Petrotoga halophila DSM 16923 TaxID=1122953 RepID=A0A2S5EBZ3_9BACT|nr:MULTISPECIES: hypothetical protein [Petrotoga]PNR89204.1 hypothetical protein X925_03250 [Petrotoga sp. 9T1HF07.CasAA.8.2]POZ90654.1 hypothetical protein AA81_11295 [Petrotoga halophila DSM 16923]